MSPRLSCFQNFRMPAMIALCACLASGMAHATGLVAVEGHEFREIINQPRSVSSTSVVGLVLLPAADAPGNDGRHVWVRFNENQPAGRQIRIELESADGRYRGYGRFTGSAAAHQWIPVTLLGNTTKRPKDIPLENIAIKVVQVASDGRDLPVPVAATWSNPAELPPQTLRLNINSRRAPVLRIGGEARMHACRRVSSASVAVFDYHCDIPLSEVQPAAGQPASVTITRQDGFQLDSFDVALPALRASGR